MATKPLTSEAIAITEKKMDMTLDEIIKMSKTNPSKGKKQRLPNKSEGFLNNVSLDKSAKVQRFMDSRSTIRQGALAKRRSNFQRNQFPLATEAARKAGFAPIHNRTFSRARMMNANMNANNNPRIVAPSVQRKIYNQGFAVKPQMKMVNKQQQRPTLDSMFANMKEQRMRAYSQQNNNNGGNNGGDIRFSGGNQRQPQYWQRGRGGRFGN